MTAAADDFFAHARLPASRRIGAGISAQSPFNALQTPDLEIRNDGAAIASGPLAIGRRRESTTALAWTAGAHADVLHATYRVSLIGLPIGAVNLNADLTPTSYSIAGDAKVTGLAKLFVANAHGASAGKGAIVQGHVSPASFATIASSSHMTRTIRMALAGNAVTGIDISPPFQDKPDRVPLGTQRQAWRCRSGRRGHPSGAALGTDALARCVQPHGSDL